MKKTTKFALGAVALIAVSAGVAGVTSYAILQSKDTKNASFYEEFQTAAPASYAALDASKMQPVDLTQAAESSLNSVVHIMAVQRSKTKVIQTQPDIFDFFFGDGRGRQQEVRTPEQRGFGSGVIISKDGYIVTNNHVIDDADEISVKLHDGREMKGRVIGTDATTDLALVKIEGDDFPAIPVGDSDALKVGEWVLAVGNPFNLGSTVTAGVVSAKARGLGANQVESFIQTDAAINQGNSGGALVNAKGELVGINAMLVSPTGAYSGYGFAIPTKEIGRTGERLDIDGLEMEFVYVEETEAPVEIMIWFPQLKAFCTAEVITRNLHNLQTPRGAKVRERNFRTRAGEIDLIVELDGCIVFVEVKRRSTPRLRIKYSKTAP